jgi:hypothetical protein
MHTYNRAKQAVMLETDRPVACGRLSWPAATAEPCHVQKYLQPLLERIQQREIDPSFVITHRMRLDDAAEGFATFLEKQDDCVKIVLKPH